MYRRERGFRELAGWQCLAGRSVLRMEAKELASLAATTKLTIHRFEAASFMPRPETVLRIEVALRQQGIYPIWDKRGEPKGVILGWQGYGRAYPDRPPVKHRPDDIGKKLREHPEKIYQGPSPADPPQQPAIAALEVEEARIMAELARLRAAARDEEESTW